MPLITKILIILFFLVLSAKPTYFAVIEEEVGVFSACSPLLYVVYLKIKYPQEVVVINRNKYEKLWAYAKELENEQEQKK